VVDHTKKEVAEMKKDKSAGERQHITDGSGTCWCNPTIETYAKGKKVGKPGKVPGSQTIKLVRPDLTTSTYTLKVDDTLELDLVLVINNNSDKTTFNTGGCKIVNWGDHISISLSHSAELKRHLLNDVIY
jgi:hypothetical protein